MRAFVYRRYGSPDVLELMNVAKPVPGPDEVVVRTRAASVNPIDWHFLRGSPALVRLVTGLVRPKKGRLGVDVAGVVESVGTKVTGFRTGDEVFGASRGTVAEFVAVREDRLAAKPGNVTFEQAAAVPVAALSALQGLRDKAHLRAGEQVLIIGASGGVGTFAVQIAKAFGADVTGVCSTSNLEMVAAIGADRVVDYTREDFTRGEARYDAVFDCIGDRPLSDYGRVMNPQAVYVGVGGSAGTVEVLFGFLKVAAVSPFVSQKFVSFLATLSGEDLADVAELIQDGTVTPVIDRLYPFERAADAVRYLEKGHAKGKVVVTIGESVAAGNG